LPLRYHASHTATQDGHIPFVTRDKMDVHMHNRLTSNFTNVDADVITVRVVLLIDPGPGLIK
jgi:hypothetical protein